MSSPLGSLRISPSSAKARSTCSEGVSSISGIVNRSSETIGSELSTVVPAIAVEALPRVTGCYVEVRLDSLNLLLVVHVEIEKSVALELLDVLISTCTVVVVAVPSCRRVGSEVDVLLRLAHVVTEVEVKMEVGEPFESVINLQVTIAAEHGSLVVFVACHSNRVVHTVGVERRTVHLRVVTVPELVAGE